MNLETCYITNGFDKVPFQIDRDIIKKIKDNANKPLQKPKRPYYNRSEVNIWSEMPFHEKYLNPKSPYYDSALVARTQQDKKRKHKISPMEERFKW